MREENREIEFAVCVSVLHLTAAHSFAHFLQPIKHFAQILSRKKGGKKSEGGIREKDREGGRIIESGWRRRG